MRNGWMPLDPLARVTELSAVCKQLWLHATVPIAMVDTASTCQPDLLRTNLGQLVRDRHSCHTLVTPLD